jgi:hypothetical protein
MKRLVCMIGLLAAAGLTTLVLGWSEPEPSDEPSGKIACAYYGETCVSPEAISKAYFRLFP